MIADTRSTKAARARHKRRRDTLLLAVDVENWTRQLLSTMTPWQRYWFDTLLSTHVERGEVPLDQARRISGNPNMGHTLSPHAVKGIHRT
jgi:hypothetical protein